MMNEYNKYKKIMIIISALLFLVLLYDIFGLGAENIIQFSIIKLLFIASLFLPIQLYKYPKLKDLAPCFSMLIFYVYINYYMITFHYSYYAAYIQCFMLGPILFSFKKTHFFVTYLIGLALLVWGTFQLQGNDGIQTFTQNVLEVSLPVWFVSFFWYFTIQKYTEKIQEQEKKFAELGKTSSFLLHEIQAPLNRLKSKHHIEEVRVKEIKQIGNILDVSQAISARRLENIQHETTEMSEIVYTNIKHYINAINIEDIQLELELEEYELRTNKELSEIIVKNLIQNAIEHLYTLAASEYKVLKITGKKHGTNYHISIANNYVKKPRFDLTNMFEPLYSTKEGVMSRGLGLFICKKIGEVLNLKITNNTKDKTILFECIWPS